MQNKKTKLIVINAIIAALYVVITSLTAFMAFRDIQFRIAEMLNHLFAFDKKYGIGVVTGVLLVNSAFMSASGLGLMDLVFGLGHTIASFAISALFFKSVKDVKTRMFVLAGVFSVMIFLVAIELNLALELPFWLSYGETFFGEIVVLLAGVPLMTALNKAIDLKKLIND